MLVWIKNDAEYIFKARLFKIIWTKVYIKLKRNLRKYIFHPSKAGLTALRTSILYEVIF